VAEEMADGLSLAGQAGGRSREVPGQLAGRLHDHAGRDVDQRGGPGTLDRHDLAE
jgi:hypothetical protein